MDLSDEAGRRLSVGRPGEDPNEVGAAVLLEGLVHALGDEVVIPKEKFTDTPENHEVRVKLDSEGNIVYRLMPIFTPTMVSDEGKA